MSKPMRSLPRRSIRLAQNFLKDPALIETLIRNRTDLGKADTVFEIGPGRGVITEVLARVCGQVIAIEFAPRLAAQLRLQFSERANVKILQGDVLKLEFPAAPFKVCSNIPFNITADIFRKMFHSNHPPASAYLIVQRAAAEKYSGIAGERLVSLLLKPWYEMCILHTFKCSDFDPAPAVDVVFLEVKHRLHPLIGASDAELYRKLVLYAFNRHNANLGKRLKKVFSHLQWKRLSEDMSFDVHAQPTDLGCEQWIGILRFLVEGTKEGFVKVPQELLHSTVVAPRDNSDLRQGSRTQRWKNRKARQED